MFGSEGKSLRTISVRVLRDVTAGSPLNISYIDDLLQSVEERQSYLKQYLFDCRCDLCSDELTAGASKHSVAVTKIQKVCQLWVKARKGGEPKLAFDCSVKYVEGMESTLPSNYYQLVRVYRNAANEAVNVRKSKGLSRQVWPQP